MKTIPSFFEELQPVIVQRGISQLVHFTPLNNLFSIIELQALIARDRVLQIAKERKDQFLLDYVSFNDSMRLDARTNFINLSIEHPNISLFKRFRERYNDCNVWCVLLLTPNCLALPGALFCVGNAASTRVRACGTGATIEHLLALFADNVIAGNQFGQRTLNRHGLAACYTTDPQAEVLIPGEISLSFVKGIAFENAQALQRAKSALTLLCPDLLKPNFEILPELFNERPISNG